MCGWVAGASVPRGFYEGPLVTAAVLRQLAIFQGSFAYHLNQPHVHASDVVFTERKCSRPTRPFRKLCHLRVRTVAAQISHVTAHLAFIAQRTAASAKVLSL